MEFIYTKNIQQSQATTVFRWASATQNHKLFGVKLWGTNLSCFLKGLQQFHKFWFVWMSESQLRVIVAELDCIFVESAPKESDVEKWIRFIRSFLVIFFTLVYEESSVSDDYIDIVNKTTKKCSLDEFLLKDDVWFVGFSKLSFSLAHC